MGTTLLAGSQNGWLQTEALSAFAVTAFWLVFLGAG